MAIPRVRGATLASTGIRRARNTPLRWTARTAACAVAIGGLPASAAGLTVAQAATPHATKATVVKVVTRHPFGKMLATIHGRSLYILPTGSCSGGCIAAWPRLLMPKHTTVPLGTHCLKTVRVGHRLQVTYRGKRLYLFYLDSGSSVNGNGQGGFKVAKVISGPC